ncbi:MAG: oxidoreductase [Hydrocarboniphaga sp.]|uniref:SDR family NAD(P)-dependent oxidoreductase n=1 Tax=Hydrocarboniphaga sp. TaxID=2033016 RepID=UPI00261E93D8|nr:SDR family NAD(P)-dependent oxidoreductase [Hydrocarboniphaga sp.]MDB5969951.1 oxidoreductase [Hydrocarboniphaga sp.]
MPRTAPAIVRGPFSRTSTAEEAVAGIDLSGKLAVVTGGSGGIGRETARVLSQAGAHVVIGGRDEQALLTAKRDIAAISMHAHVSEHPLDLVSVPSIRAFASAVASLGRAVDILVCNAGVMAVPLEHAPCGIESQLMINCVGHALLTSLLSPMLRRTAHARLVYLTSSGHQLSPLVLDDLNFRNRPYDKWKAYGQSKTACSLLAVYVAGQMMRKGVTAMAVHPGVIMTALGRSLSDGEREELAKRLHGDEKTIQAGAATSVWAATAPELEGQPPAYLEDCAVAEVIDTPNYHSGVMPYALDADQATRLWREMERMLGEPLPL